MKPRCEICVFFYYGDPGDPKCRRFPPKASSLTLGSFPEVKPDWWCGEWRSVLEMDTAEDRRSAIRGGLGT